MNTLAWPSAHSAFGGASYALGFRATAKHPLRKLLVFNAVRKTVTANRYAARDPAVARAEPIAVTPHAWTRVTWPEAQRQNQRISHEDRRFQRQAAIRGEPLAV